ncbi:preprotein translocase subunit YajC [Herbihabitans rhizosphaerae]|uniref:Preprotein translocase subunit YajC n=1 Tax=Herbihabitans rhizosphaerae TaxID=1872711 RepID=A0A4Q7KKA8_9PSEU|nr:preprotein translocase subunit YajC [Herbihabitans rhizosphaerae]RZS34346.1 preprotein translocase subunit YajC [Herbihabitans rhizosphaerae]
MNAGSLLPFLLIAVLAIPLFLGARKQKRAMQQQQALQSSLSVGDRVMTTSGLYGTVSDTSDDASITVEIAPGVETEWLRQAVREKVGDDVVDEVEDDEDDDAADDTVEETVESTKSDKSDEPAVLAESTNEVAEPAEQGKKTR